MARLTLSALAKRKKFGLYETLPLYQVLKGPSKPCRCRWSILVAKERWNPMIKPPPEFEGAKRVLATYSILSRSSKFSLVAA